MVLEPFVLNNGVCVLSEGSETAFIRERRAAATDSVLVLCPPAHLHSVFPHRYLCTYEDKWAPGPALTYRRCHSSLLPSSFLLSSLA